MNGFLLQSVHGEVGIALINEERKINNVIYDCLSRHLLITFADGETEQLDDEINTDFNAALLSRRDIFIGHFASDNFSQNVTDEYQVPLRQ